jgi:hypothetical protein
MGMMHFCLSYLKGCNIGVIDGRTYEMHHSNGLRGQDTSIHTKYHDYRFRHLSNIKAITATILEAITLVLLIEEIYEVCH